MEKPNIRFKEFRELLGLSIQEFAEKTGLTVKRLKNIEAGKVKIRVNEAVEVSNVFNISMDYLLGRIDEPLPKFWADDERGFLEQIKNMTPEDRKMILKKMEELLNTEQESS